MMRQVLCALASIALLACAGDVRPEEGAEPPPEASRDPGPHLDFDGIGAAKVGMNIDSLGAILGEPVLRVQWNPPDCDYANIRSLPSVSFMIFGDTLVRIDVMDSAVMTTLLVGVGSTEDAVRRAYPSTRIEPHPYDIPEGRYLVVDDPDDAQLGMVFETDGERVVSYRAGRRDAVALKERCS